MGVFLCYIHHHLYFLHASYNVGGMQTCLLHVSHMLSEMYLKMTVDVIYLSRDMTVDVIYLSR